VLFTGEKGVAVPSRTSASVVLLFQLVRANVGGAAVGVAGVGVPIMIAPLAFVLNQACALGLLALPRMSPTQAA
jgi:hypothetical protein